VVGLLALGFPLRAAFRRLGVPPAVSLMAVGLLLGPDLLDLVPEGYSAHLATPLSRTAFAVLLVRAGFGLAPGKLRVILGAAAAAARSHRSCHDRCRPARSDCLLRNDSAWPRECLCNARHLCDRTRRGCGARSMGVAPVVDRELSGSPSELSLVGSRSGRRRSTLVRRSATGLPLTHLTIGGSS